MIKTGFMEAGFLNSIVKKPLYKSVFVNDIKG